MLNIKKFLTAIGLVPKDTTEIDSQGELEVLNTDGKLRYHNGTSVSPVVTESHSATLSNKELTSPVINTQVTGDALETDLSTSASGTKIPTAAATKAYTDSVSGVVAGDVSNLVSLTGMPVDSTTLGTFTEDVIPDNQTIKQALQVLETASVNIETNDLKAGVLNTDLIDTLNENPATDTQLPSALAVKTYVDSSIASKDQASEISYDNTTSELAALNLQTAVDEVDGNVDNLVSLSGVALDSTTLGTFTGTTIPDNQTVKQSLQALETAHEEVDGNVDNLVTLSGVALGSTNLGSFTGNTIPDNQDNKQALQALETAHEAHTGASTNVHGIEVGSSVVGTTDSQSLTNKTLTGAVIDGSTKISAFLLEESEDNSQSGSLVTLTSITKPIVRLTNASLVSVTGITASEITGHGGVVTLINATGNPIDILNNSGTTSEAFLTGINATLTLQADGCILLKYDTVSDKWRVIGGTGSGSSEPLELGYTTQKFSGNSSTTNFTLSPAVTSKDSLLVFINGIYQDQSSYSYLSPTISFTSAPPTGTDNIEVKQLNTSAIVAPANSFVVMNETVGLNGVSPTATGILHFKAPKNMVITSCVVQMFEKNGVVVGTLEVDIKKNATPNDTGMTSIFSVKPSFNFAVISDYAESTGTLATTSVSSGEYLRLDATSIPSGFIGYIQVAVMAA